MENLLTTKKLICDFMGVKPLMSAPDSYYWRDGVFFSSTSNNPEKVMNDIVNYIKYDTDWNLLMSVVEKIENLKPIKGYKPSFKWIGFTFNIRTDNTTACKYTTTVKFQRENGYMVVSTSFSNQSKIDAVYKAVVEFIQWYNQNK